MICCCSLAGTQACKNCLQYIEHFGKQQNESFEIIERAKDVCTVGKIYIATTQTGTPSISETIEPKRGEWIPIIEGNEFGEPYQSGVYCSECGETLGYEANYCPNCGAKMKGE